MVANLKALLSEMSLAEFRKGARLAASGCDVDCCELIFSRLLKLDLERSWEVACIAINALGTNGYTPAKDFLRGLWCTGADHSMVVYSAARAYVRIARNDLSDASPVLEIVREGGYSAKEGALNALGYDKMIPSENEMTALLTLCWDFGADRDKRGLGDPRYGLVAACAGWRELLVTNDFLKHCIDTGDPPVQHVAANSLAGKYVRLR